MRFYVITYDISDDKRRKKVADVLEGYGQRVQYSVFECHLTPKQYQQLCRRLQQKVKLPEDNLRFYPLSRHTYSQVETWGETPLTPIPSSTIIA